MFPRLISFTLIAMPLLVAATKIRRIDASQVCPGTGSLLCCNVVEDASGYECQSFLATPFGALINAAIGPITGTVGLTCNPIIGLLTTSSCTQQAACCTNNTFYGIISTGCIPVGLLL